MSKETITFRIEAEKRKALGAIATRMDCDRSYILNEAISAYLETNQWQIEHIQAGLRQADAEEFATEAEVRAAFEKWRRWNSSGPNLPIEDLNDAYDYIAALTPPLRLILLSAKAVTA